MWRHHIAWYRSRSGSLWLAQKVRAFRPSTAQAKPRRRNGVNGFGFDANCNWRLYLQDQCCLQRTWRSRPIDQVLSQSGDQEREKSRNKLAELAQNSVHFLASILRPPIRFITGLGPKKWTPALAENLVHGRWELHGNGSDSFWPRSTAEESLWC